MCLFQQVPLHSQDALSAFYLKALLVDQCTVLVCLWKIQKPFLEFSVSAALCQGFGDYEKVDPDRKLQVVL